MAFSHPSPSQADEKSSPVSKRLPDGFFHTAPPANFTSPKPLSTRLLLSHSTYHSSSPDRYNGTRLQFLFLCRQLGGFGEIGVTALVSSSSLKWRWEPILPHRSIEKTKWVTIRKMVDHNRVWLWSEILKIIFLFLWVYSKTKHCQWLY